MEEGGEEEEGCAVEEVGDRGLVLSVVSVGGALVVVVVVGGRFAGEGWVAVVAGLFEVGEGGGEEGCFFVFFLFIVVSAAAWGGGVPVHVGEVCGR